MRSQFCSWLVFAIAIASSCAPQSQASQNDDGGEAGDMSPPPADQSSPLDLDATDAAPEPDLKPPPVPLTDNLCIEDGWCWERPTLGFGANLNGVWGASYADVWAVGDGGTILHFDGTAWYRLPPPTSEPLVAVHGSGHDDVWAIGPRSALHWNGTAWSGVAGVPSILDSFRTVHAVAKNDVWIGGNNQKLLHYDGVSWQAFFDAPGGYANDIYSIVGFAPNDVWAGGERVLLHWDGNTWKEQPYLYFDLPQCRDLWGFGPNDLFVACMRAPYHWNGTAWTEFAPTAVNTSASVVVASSKDDVWLFSQLGMYRWDGTTWSEDTAARGEPIRDAWLDASGNGFAVGVGGRILTREGANWVETSGSSQTKSIRAITLAPNGDAWAVDYAGAYRHSAGGWVSASVGGTTPTFAAAWAPAANDIWIAGSVEDGTKQTGLIERWNGTSFAVFKTGSPEQGLVTSLWGAANDDVWLLSAAGDIYHWDGALLLPRMSPFQPSLEEQGGRIHGRNANDVWIGYGGNIAHYNGTTLFTESLPDTPPVQDWGFTVTAVHAIAADDVWVAGKDAYLAHYDGTTWSSAPPKPELAAIALGTFDYEHIVGFAGDSTDDVWAIDSTGKIFHFDGTSWTLSSHPGVKLLTIGKAPNGDVLVGGERGAILRRHL